MYFHDQLNLCYSLWLSNVPLDKVIEFCSVNFNLFALSSFIPDYPSNQIHICFSQVTEPGHEKMCLMSYANNKGADQPAHPRSLISAFVVRCLDSVISLDSIAGLRLELASVAALAGLCLAWSETLKDTFCRVVAQSKCLYT